MDFKDYINVLRNLLMVKFYNNQLLDAKGKVITDETKARNFIDNVIRSAELQGQPDPNSPYYPEVMTYLQPMWEAQAETQKAEKVEEKSRWESEFNLQKEKFAFDKEQFQKQLEQSGQPTWWQQQQLNMWEKERGDELSKLALQSKIGAQDVEARRLTNLMSPPEWGREQDRLNQQILAQQFEMERQSMVNQLRGNPSRNWYQMIQAQYAKNPYSPEPKETSASEHLRKVSEEYLRLAPEAALLKARIETGEIEPGTTLWQAAQGTIKSAEYTQKLSEQLKEVVYGKETLSIAKEWRMSPNQARDTATRYWQNPDAPEWSNLKSDERADLLAAVQTSLLTSDYKPSAPGEDVYEPPVRDLKQEALEREFQPISKMVVGGKLGGEVITPSWQQWRATPVSSQAKLAGYSEDVLKQPFEDISNRMAYMLPQNPSLGRRWQPARQVA